MRLYDRIARDGLAAALHKGEFHPCSGLHDFPSPTARVIADGPMRNFYGEQDRQWGRPSDLGILKPPYPWVWIEGNRPDVSYFDGSPRSTRGQQDGFLVTETDGHISVIFFFYSKSFAPIPCVCPVVSHIKCTEGWGSDLVHENVPLLLNGAPADGWEGLAEERGWASIAFPALYALSLMNCKNVTVEDFPHGEKLAKAHKKRHGVPMSRFSRIVLPNQRGASGGGNGGGGASAKHLVRGHFKTYTTEAPLMGRHVGTYWWGWHARGDSALGDITPEYHVAAPTEGTAP